MKMTPKRKKNLKNEDNPPKEDNLKNDDDSKSNMSDNKTKLG